MSEYGKQGTKSTSNVVPLRNDYGIVGSNPLLDQPSKSTNNDLMSRDEAIGFLGQRLDQIYYLLSDRSIAYTSNGMGNGGGGGMDELGRRVAVLEKKVDDIDVKLQTVSQDIRSVREQLRELPHTLNLELSKTIAENIKGLPSEDKIKVIVTETLEKYPSEDKVKNIVNDSVVKLPDENKMKLIVAEQKEEIFKEIKASRKQLLTWLLGVPSALWMLSLIYNTYIAPNLQQTPNKPAVVSNQTNSNNGVNVVPNQNNHK
ncbi:hypothetical protein [Brevibacillus dissolubilis]|uniref:hypothetical protein n=1 Tax=Brevibacillus dissolubilis TaxID=1844116 RepID=UPI0011162824|nr:hypothetical protein [Brevibacillus dissolubilis]